MIYTLCLVFATILFIIVFPSGNRKINNFLLLSVAVLLICVAGFREQGTDRDYLIYAYYWNNKYISDVEYSFVLIRNMLNFSFGLPIMSLFIFYAVLGVSIKMKAIKILSGTAFLSVLVYISNYYLVHELTQIRAGVAAGLFLISIKYIYERNFYKYILIILLAGFFHYSAFMALPMWFLKPDDKRIKYFFVLIPLGFVLYFLGSGVIANIPIPYVQNKIEVYENMQDLGIGEKQSFNVFSVSFLSKIGTFLILYFNRSKIIIKNKYFYLLLKIYAISLFSFPVLSGIPAFSYRVQSLFGVVDIILVSSMVYLFRHKFIGYLAVILITTSFLIYNIFISELIK